MCGEVVKASVQSRPRAEEGLPLLRKNVDMQQQLGIHSEILSARELAELDPFLFHDDLAAGAYEPDSGYADPALTTNSFVEAAQRLGVQLCPRTVASELKAEQGRIVSVVANGEHIFTRTVVNVAGPWGAQVAGRLGSEIPITPTRHAVVLMRRPPQWQASTPVWIDLVTGFYFKPEGLSKILIGSIREEEAHEEVDPDTYCSAVDYETTAAYAEQGVRRFPIMAEGAAQGGWAGVYDVTLDSLPVIDEVPDVKDLYCAVGFSGHGFKLAPAVGTILAELVMDGKCSSYDTSVFRFARFHEQRLTPSKYQYKILG